MLSLADVPIEHLLMEPNWLTSANGLKGEIFSISHHKSGVFNDVILTLRWQGEHGIKTSIAKWPDDCSKVKVDMDMYPKVLRPFADACIERSTKFWAIAAEQKNT